MQCLSLTRMHAALDQLHINTHNYKQTGTNISFWLLRAIPTLKYQLSLTLIIHVPSKAPASSNLKCSAQTVNSCLTCGTLVLPDTFNLKQNTLD